MTEETECCCSSSRRFRDQAMVAALSATPQGVVVTDDRGQVALVNDRARSMLGLREAEDLPLEAPPDGCFLPDGVTPFPPDRWPVLRALQSEWVTQELLHFRSGREKERRWVCASCRPLAETGFTGGTLLTLYEISDESIQAAMRQAARGSLEFPPVDFDFRGREACIDTVRSLRQRYDLVSRAVQQTADTVLITDRAGVIEFVNPAFEETSGYTAAEAIGRTPRLLKSGVQDERFYREMWRGLLQGNPFLGEIVNRKKTGELYRAQQSITPLTSESGEITHFVSVLKDVTELRQAQERQFYMEVAQEVQQRFYRPPVSPPGFEVAAAARTVHHTGGDYFDVLRQSDGSVLLVIADVVGHGFGAALVMAEVRAYIRAMARQEVGAGKMLSRINKILFADLAPNQFVTLLIVRVDPSTGEAEYASAGHTVCLIVDADQDRVHELSSTGTPLGLFPERTYPSRRLGAIGTGDLFLLVTDGIVEASDRRDEQFGVDRLVALARRGRRDSPSELISRVWKEVDRFREGREQVDDYTCLVCRRAETPISGSGPTSR